MLGEDFVMEIFHPVPISLPLMLIHDEQSFTEGQGSQKVHFVVMISCREFCQKKTLLGLRITFSLNITASVQH